MPFETGAEVHARTESASPTVHRIGDNCRMEFVLAAPFLLFLWRLPAWGRQWLAFLRDLRRYRAGY
jgi:hypothetical protein